MGLDYPRALLLHMKGTRMMAEGEWEDAIETEAERLVDEAIEQAEHMAGCEISTVYASITGEQIPAPPQKFGGKIERTTEGSKPYWPARIEPLYMTSTCAARIWPLTPARPGTASPSPASSWSRPPTSARHPVPG